MCIYVCTYICYIYIHKSSQDAVDTLNNLLDKTNDKIFQEILTQACIYTVCTLANVRMYICV